MLMARNNIVLREKVINVFIDLARYLTPLVFLDMLISLLAYFIGSPICRVTILLDLLKSGSHH